MYAGEMAKSIEKPVSDKLDSRDITSGDAAHLAAAFRT